MTDHRHDQIWRCDCGGSHFLSVSYWHEGGPIHAGSYLQVEGDFRPMLRGRLKHAWEILRDGHADTYVGVLLDETTVRDIIRVLQDIADGWAENRPPPVPDEPGT